MITRIEVGPDGEATFWFDGNPEPWSLREFGPGTVTREALDVLLDAVDATNTVLAARPVPENCG